MIRRIFEQFSLAILGALTLGVAQAADAPPANVVAPAAVREPAISTAPVSRSYVIKSSDEVKLDVYDEPDLNVTSVVDENGMAKFPLIDSIPVGGKTVDQATRLIHEALARDYLVNPKVRLDVTRHARRAFSIIGFVKSSGSYEIVGSDSISLVEAISMAGGATSDGNLKKITVMRPPVEGQSIRIWRGLNAVEMMRNEKARPFDILPGDTIEVPDKVF